MLEATPELRDLAWRLLLSEAGGRDGPAGMAEALDRVVDKLQGQLAPLIGSAGFLAILTRTHRRAERKFPGLRDLAPGGSLSDRVQAQLPGQVEPAVLAVLTEILFTLVSLIGRDLSFKIMASVWRDVLNGGRFS